MEGAEGGAGVDAEVIGEAGAQGLVGGEGLALAAGQIERPHLEGAQTLPQGVAGHEVRQFAGEQHMVPGFEAGLGLLLQHGEPLFGEAPHGPRTNSSSAKSA